MASTDNDRELALDAIANLSNVSNSKDCIIIKTKNDNIPAVLRINLNMAIQALMEKYNISIDDVEKYIAEH